MHVTDATETTEGGGEDAPKVTWNQEMFTDAEAVEQLHPKIRRMIKAELKSHTDTTRAKGQAKAQKRAAAQRMMNALQKMDNDFEQWMSEMLLDYSKAEVSQLILSKANQKHATMKGQTKTKMKKKTTKKMGLGKFVKSCIKFLVHNLQLSLLAQ